MSGRLLCLDFAAGTARRVPGGRFALLMALAGFAWAALDYLDVRSSHDHLVAKRAAAAPPEAAGRPRPSVSIQQAKETAEKIKAVNAHVLALNTPWESILRAIEPPKAMAVALLSLDTSGRGGALRVAGLAARPEGMTDYVSLLAERRAIGTAYLLKHEIMPDSEYRFDVEAEWRQAR